MPTYVDIPWAAWYGDSAYRLSFPDTWEIEVCRMRGGDDIGDEGIRQVLADPIGTPPLGEISRDVQTAAILVDDLSRPTPAFRLLPYVLEDLHEAGIPEEGITIIAALAAHRPMTRDDFVKKVGEEIVRRYRVVNHNAYENLEHLGSSSQGVPIFVNRDLMSCQIRIAMGMITPRGGMFGGGAKLLLPGACGQQTIMLNHRHIHGSAFRPHLAEVARMAGVNYVVNPLLNEQLEIMDLVAGDTEEAYWRGCELGRQRYATPIPSTPVDVGVFNAFPKDTELCQAGLAMTPLSGANPTLLREDSTVVILSASPEGLGWHSVLGPGTALRGNPGPRSHRTFLLSPGVNRYDCEMLYGSHVCHFTDWGPLLAELIQIHGDSAGAAVFPAGALQMADNRPF
ncbi:MAG: lactate racemase domain-containing protein [Candidatus Latescibacterota bacterium]|nr:lactate racemase domain-containing protein [Candidatus Latescibacterota bacterium]